MIRKFIRVVLTFYLTAPVIGCCIAVVVCLANAWKTHDPFLAAAAVIFGVAVVVIFALAFWAIHQLTKDPQNRCDGCLTQ